MILWMILLIKSSEAKRVFFYADLFLYSFQVIDKTFTWHVNHSTLAFFIYVFSFAPNSACGNTVIIVRIIELYVASGFAITVWFRQECDLSQQIHNTGEKKQIALLAAS